VLDPRTGQPVPTRASVSVLAATSMRADALATALLVMGRLAAAAWAVEHPDAGVLWLEPAGESTRAWTWNLKDCTAAPGVRVEWMRAPSTTRGGRP
jgi:thiamine biosynthesis lipoprotein ApbE